LKPLANVAIDPKDVGELQKALNDAAGKASVLWTTFIIFQLYLAIAFGSVTHHDLFLETPIKLPLLNVDLPLVGFFVVAPLLLLIFHFYLFLQLLGLAITAKDYNALLAIDVPDVSDRQYVRRRLDVFPILRFLAGPRDQRTGFFGFSLRLIAWITLVATPVLILLQGQVTFLPYHREWIVWLQRIAVLIDLAMVWYFWIRLRSDNDPIGWVPRKAKMWLGGAGTLCVVIFSIYLATFSGEWLKTHLPELRYIPTTWRPHRSENDWTSLQALLFEGNVDYVSRRPQSVFSNRLVLDGQSFVVDPEKLDKITVSRSFRGRDLRLAVLSAADLRKVDFTGAQLQGALLVGAQLQGASLAEAQLQGASLDWAQMQGAWLVGAQLQGARLLGAQVKGASLRGVMVWRARDRPLVYLADVAEFDPDTVPWGTNSTFAAWRDAILDSIPPGTLRNAALVRLSALDPAAEKEKDVIESQFWNEASSAPPQGEERENQLIAFLAALGCSSDGAPHVARGLIEIGLLYRPMSRQVTAVADKFYEWKSDPTACPGVKDFTDEERAIFANRRAVSRPIQPVKIRLK
jgi:Pentapeptide repeats (8 copies)